MNEFTQLAEQGADPTMIRKARQAVLKAAVMRQIFCQASGDLLDVRRAVYILAPDQQVVVTAAVWDDRRAGFEAAVAAHDVGEYEVYDGRELY